MLDECTSTDNCDQDSLTFPTVHPLYFSKKVSIRSKAVNREVKLSRRYRDRDLAKFESSRRYRER